MNLVEFVNSQNMKGDLPQLRSGDRVRVKVRVKEGDKERLQTFEGDVIRIRKAGVGSTFTVRKVSFGVGVERTFPFHSPVVGGIEIVRHQQVRRAKLYYLRDLKGKAARLREDR